MIAVFQTLGDHGKRLIDQQRLSLFPIRLSVLGKHELRVVRIPHSTLIGCRSQPDCQGARDEDERNRFRFNSQLNVVIGKPFLLVTREETPIAEIDDLWVCRCAHGCTRTELTTVSQIDAGGAGQEETGLKLPMICK